jgi:LAO/AO transport system kinase
VTKPAPPPPELPPLDAATAALVEGSRRLEKHPLARLISLLEQDGDGVVASKVAVLRHLATTSARGCVIGVTGTPGAGKSSLIGRLALELIASDASARVAVLAIDPTSVDSGGALLGDRVRTHFPVGERRIFFRSQATQGDLGGVGRRTWAVTRLLRHLFDVVFVETVGVGQSEIEIAHMADVTLLVLQPLTGDHVQFMKAGVMDIPDAFVVNKCDEAALARRSVYELRAALQVARLGSGDPVIFETSAVTGRGIAELARYVCAAPRRPLDLAHFVRRAVRDAYGRVGLAAWEARGGPDALATARDPIYEEAEATALAVVRAALRA